MAEEFKSATVKLGDLVKKPTAQTKLRVRLSLDEGTMGALFAVVEIEEA